MFTEKQHLTSISGIELDQYLNNGWYRMGQIIFTCHFLFFEENLYSPIWTRLPLKDYRFRKSLRKLKKSAESRFKVAIKDGKVTAAKEKLYQIYRKGFNGELAPSLMESLQDNSTFNVYNSKSVEVYDGANLIAFSFFDVGATSIASIQGIYHPAYARHSLGFYTMVREIQYGLNRNFEFYYPGYIVPGNERFDYKLRIGKKEEVEFYDLKSRSWKKFIHFSNQNIPVEILGKKLTTLGWELSKENISCQILYYPAYDARIFGQHEERLLESPLFLNLFNNIFHQPKFIAYYDIWKEKFIFCHTIVRDELHDYFEYSDKYDKYSSRHFLDFIAQKSKLIETSNPGEITTMAKSLRTLMKIKK
ncbi:MAG: arginine-tRNA-protein transferase [Bacteroidota bacterium]